MFGSYTVMIKNINDENVLEFLIFLNLLIYSSAGGDFEDLVYDESS